jgi:ATP-dependent RNA helicase DeaD
VSDSIVSLGFAELSLRPEILRSISEMGFETPSPIQAQAIPLMLGKDVDFLGLAGTGTGKTAAFAIPLLERVDVKVRAVQALILCPTRELAQQVAGQISLLGKYLRVKVATVYGGAPYGEQIAALRGGAQIVVGTPGRVIDHLDRATLNLDAVRTLILDEADEMFSMGFKEEIDRVILKIGDDSNTWLFSATMSPEVRRVVQSSLHDPVTVQVSKSNTLAAGVEQLYFRVNEGEKPETICKLIEAADEFYGLIFCQTKALVADLTRFMLDRGYKVDCLHGDMDQSSRERTMQAFRDKKLKVLICTDVAARGLDVKDITHVVNYSLPRELESYVHRIGRTARSGKTGIVMNLVTFSHRHLLGRIEQHTRAQMKEAFIPGKREIAAKKVARLLPVFMDQPVASRVMDVMGEDFRTELAALTPEEIASRFIIMMMPDIFGGAEARPKSAAKAQAAVAKVLAPKAAESAAAVAAPVAVPAVPKVAKKVAKVAPAAVETPVADVASMMTENAVDMNAPIETPDEALAASAAIIEDITHEAVPAQELAAVHEADEEVIEDEVIETEVVAAPKRKTASAPKPTFLDEPPRSRKKPLDDEELVSMLESPAAFGVVKADDRAPRGAFPRSDRFADRGSFPRSGERERSFPRSSDRGDQQRTGRFERAGGGFREERPRREGYAPIRTAASRPVGVSRPVGSSSSGSRPVASSGSRPVASAASRPVAARPAAPMNLGKPPKHEAGPARTAREGETGGLNRRARRALLFGRSLEGTSDGATESTN